jgi:hypothetical protein
MRILSKSTVIATALLLALLATSCARVLPWRRQAAAPEVNLAFMIDRNLVELYTMRVNDRPGRFLLGTAAPRTLLDPRYAGTGAGPYALELSEKNVVRISPATLDLGGVADGIIGADVWQGRTISIDYRSGLVSYQKTGIVPYQSKMFRYDAAPQIYVNVNGTNVAAIVDTTSPDTVVLPRQRDGRGTARVTVAGVDFGALDVRYANVDTARVGNRVLSRFLVTIDYGTRTVSLWPDPRPPL